MTHKSSTSNESFNANNVDDNETCSIVEETGDYRPSVRGSNMFYMPHGLSLDLEAEHVWPTDVAMHQVFKFSVDGKKRLIELGTPFVPGSDDLQGDQCCGYRRVFVADGYCNSRVVMFSAAGKYLGEFGQSSEAYMSNSSSKQPPLYIPHKIAYAKETKMLCVADRENGRI
jgi:hypothetical protein